MWIVVRILKHKIHESNHTTLVYKESTIVQRVFASLTLFARHIICSLCMCLARYISSI